jgi:Type IV pili methyl-accepting chemotaxis transducer N-term
MKRVFAAAFILAASVQMAVAIDLKVLTQASDEPQPYDLGFAYQASENCPTLALVIPVRPDVMENTDFKRGVGMFDTYKNLQQLAGACKAAAKLYNSQKGKVAKLLDEAAPQVISVPADGRRKINLSGRQRMLSQYMAKAVCFAALGIDKPAQTNEARLAHYLFAKTLTDLRKGSATQQMLPETEPGILTALEVVDILWKSYGASVATDDLPSVVLQNPAVLAKMNDAVALVQKKYGSSGDVAPPLAAALNYSGRQRMLTQKSSKEFCLVASKIDEAANRTNMKATVALFEKSMRGLKTGDASMGLEAAPTPEIAAQIDKVEQAWAGLKVIFDKVADGAVPTPDEVATIARRNVDVMYATNEIVDLYEKLTQ